MRNRWPISTSFRIFMQFIAIFAILLLPVAWVSWFYSEIIWPYYLAMIFVLICFPALIIRLTYSRSELTMRHGFALLVMIWFGLGFLSGLPLWLLGDVSWTDAVFSGVSGLTTTGAEVFSDLTSLPVSFLFYRMWLQFIGGLGVVILALALLPLLGVAHTHHLRADLPGPGKAAQKSVKIAETAFYLWLTYSGLWLVCVLTLWGLGLDFFSAFCESLSIISTGGYSLHVENLGYYQNNAVYIAALGFMVLSSINFNLHFKILFQGDWSGYFQDKELSCYFRMFLLFSFLCALGFFAHSHLPFTFGEMIFAVIAMMTSSGHQISSYQIWPISLIFLLLVLGLVGGCSGSTSGGMKWARVQFFSRDLANAIALVNHPRAVLPQVASSTECQIRAGGMDVVLVRGYLFAFLLTFAVVLGLCLLLGLDFSTAFSAVSACISNTGVGFFGVGDNFSELSDAVKWVLLLTMLVGRIELIAFMVVLSPSYWRSR
ncbi:MAG: potassium transporter TrkG [Pseudomonadota bacterium]|nr:potassium transporter TrkG [Pseudomonadota bacterium]